MPDPVVGQQASNTTDYAALKAQYEAETAAYNAAAAAAAARSASIAAEQKAEQAKFGTVAGQTAITGATTTEDGTGKPEAMLLSSRSTAMAAEEAVDRIVSARALGDGTRAAIVLTDMGELSTSETSVFQFQVSRLQGLLSAAEGALKSAIASAAATSTPDGSGNRSLLTGVGAVLDLGSKIGSYFQTDYKFSGVEFTDPTNLTAGSIVGALRARLANSESVPLRSMTVISPSTLVPSDVAPILTDLLPADTSYRTVVGAAAAAKARADSIRTAEPKQAAALDEAVAIAGRATTAWETFINGLVTATGTEAPPLVRILRQRKLKTHLDAKPMIVLVTAQKAGAYYTKKNLWTFLGGPPLYTAGTTSLVYMVVDSRTDNVIAAGAVAKHGGYRSVGAVQKLFR